MPAPTIAAVPIPDGPGSPQAALRDYSSSVANGDARAVWNSLRREIRDKSVARCRSELDDIRKMEARGREGAAADLGTTVEALLKMSPEDFAVAQLARDTAVPAARDQARGRTVKKAEMRGNVAVVYAVDRAGRNQIFAFMREEGGWKVASRSQQLEDEEDRLNAR